ncbi:PREDICTED: uncharacterized protein LOC108782721 [Cyphomyrmex costatus]|uniref:THAP-type domain-containing protein n=1 Tax=Cyphomyrmex costatus TaxID=456900 RepID=A0A195D376_9HYME|nr:PREDICTED: uncharacterized protein LOC108782721 [Cyphomyrmex costatus]KYN06819.1 hypothetical protein ALC62_02202 [Cyphomyrmex costatus]
MPTNCAAYRCSNNSNKGYACFQFPSDVILRKKWAAALENNFVWRPTASHRVCEVHFDRKDISFTAGRKQLCKGAVPRYFCTCPYRTNRKKSTKQHDHIYSMKRLETTERVYSQDAAKKLQVRSNTLPHSYVFNEHNYCADKRNKIYSFAHADDCPLLKDPMFTNKQLLTIVNIKYE